MGIRFVAEGFANS